MSVVRHMFYGSFGTQKTMVTFISKLGQINLNIKIQNFPTKNEYLVEFIFWDSKNVIYFYLRQLEMPKIAFQKSYVINFTFFDNCTAEYKDIVLKFGVCVVFM